MKRLLLFETAPQLKKLLRQFDAHSPENIWVALSPEADYAAELASISYQPIEEFYNEAELISLGIENYQAIGEFCDTLDQNMQRYLQGIPEIGYLSAHQLFHSWKLLFDAILNRTFALKCAVENIKPDEIVSFKDVNIERRDGFGFSSSSAFRCVAPVVAEHYHLKLTQIPATFLDWQTLTGQRQRVGWLLYHLPGGSRIVDAWVRLAHRRSKLNNSNPDKELPEFKNGQPVLVAAERGYNLDYVIAEWQRQNIGPVMKLLASDSMMSRASKQEERTLRKKLTGIWHSAEFQNRLSPFFNINGLDCYPVARLRLYFCLFYVLPQYLNRVRFARERLEKLEKAVVIGNLETVACAVARRLGIPSVNYQHGGLCGYAGAPLFEHMELYAADYFFCGGEGTAKFLVEPVPSAHRSPEKHRAQPVAIGSAVLDSLVKVRNNVRSNSPSKMHRQVIYVSSGLMGDMRHHTYHLLCCPTRHNSQRQGDCQQ